MANVTFPNQRMIRIHREPAKTDFLGIKNENWQAASRDLGAHALQLYLYLASNANNYSFALSPVAVRQAIGMARSTYHDQFHKLVDKGYLVPGTGNTFDFYEIPQTATQMLNMSSAGVRDFEESPSHGKAVNSDGQTVLPEDIEINNTNMTTNAVINNSANPEGTESYIPVVKEYVIKRPVAEGRERPKPVQQQQKQAFIF